MRLKTIFLSLTLTCAISVGAATSIPEEAIKGDFNGDGLMEYIWVSADSYDEDDYPLTPLVLHSDNTSLDGTLSWDINGLMGVILVNLGSLDGGKRDYVGMVPYAMSTWCSYSGMYWNGTEWRTAVKPFTAWTGDEEYQRIVRGSKTGYVKILVNDQKGDNPWAPRWKQVRLLK